MTDNGQNKGKTTDCRQPTTDQMRERWPSLGQQTTDCRQPTTDNSRRTEGQQPADDGQL